MPFTVYEHPAIRFLLHDEFIPTSPPTTFLANRPVLLVDRTSELAQRSNATSYVRLSRDETGQGFISFSRQSWPSDVALSQTDTPITFVDPIQDVALLTSTSVQSLTPTNHLFTTWPLLTDVNRDWLQTFRLAGYQFRPDPVQPNQTSGGLVLCNRKRHNRPPPATDTAQYAMLVTGNIELLGYAPPLPLDNNLFQGKLYWQANTDLSQNMNHCLLLM